MLKLGFFHLLGTSLSPLLPIMELLPADIRHMSREWKKCPSCRSTMVDHGKLVISHAGPETGVKSCIKDAVRNKFCLMPVLRKIAESYTWKIFTLKDVQKEKLVFCNMIMIFYSVLVVNLTCYLLCFLRLMFSLFGQGLIIKLDQCCRYRTKDKVAEGSFAHAPRQSSSQA